MTEPLLRRLRGRGERLTVGALPWVAPIYRAMPQVDEVIDFPFQHGGLQFRARRAIARQINGRFDNAYVLPNSLKSALLPFLASIPKRVGYLGEARVGLLTHRLKNPKDKLPMVAFYSALSGDSAAPGMEQPQLQLAPAARDAALGIWGLPSGHYYVFAPGAEYGPAKRWPATHFAELARRLDLPIVLLGSGQEAALGDEIARMARAGGLEPVQQPDQPSRDPRAAQPRILNLAGKTSLTQALAVIAAARAVISNDSGLMHVAAAFGVPQVALFGSSSPRHTPPLSNAARVIWLKDEPAYLPPLDCAPCFERECPLGHTRCLVDLTPARVVQAL